MVLMEPPSRKRSISPSSAPVPSPLSKNQPFNIENEVGVLNFIGASYDWKAGSSKVSMSHE